ncbi:hypothetical protein [Lysobacter sp. GCM10012299]|uniref:hypothetical protein n=1 Tax=Lysobacter sp. GCM10012299 TaxID=3317333 RepID=UPI00361A305A
MKQVIVTNCSNVAIRGLAPGASIPLATDSSNVPLDAFWRRRLRDAAIDGSLRIEPDHAPETAASQANPPAAPGPATLEGPRVDADPTSPKQSKKEKAS